jgi:hypothetical protein
MFINIATCFDNNFGHHQALNEHSQVTKHIGYNMDPYLYISKVHKYVSKLYINKVLCWRL